MSNVDTDINVSPVSPLPIVNPDSNEENFSVGNEVEDYHIDSSSKSPHDVNSVNNIDADVFKIGDVDCESLSAEMLYRIIILEPEKYERDYPVKGQRENLIYTIKNFKVKDITCGDNGAYLKRRTNKRYYSISVDNDNDIVSSKVVHFSDKTDFFYKERNGRDYVDVFLFVCFYANHPSQGPKSHCSLRGYKLLLQQKLIDPPLECCEIVICWKAFIGEGVPNGYDVQWQQHKMV